MNDHLTDDRIRDAFLARAARQPVPGARGTDPRRCRQHPSGPASHRHPGPGTAAQLPLSRHRRHLRGHVRHRRRLTAHRGRARPVVSPVVSPTVIPSAAPTAVPATVVPAAAPTAVPATVRPTAEPSTAPSASAGVAIGSVVTVATAKALDLYSTLDTVDERSSRGPTRSARSSPGRCCTSRVGQRGSGRVPGAGVRPGRARALLSAGLGDGAAWQFVDLRGEQRTLRRRRPFAGEPAGSHGGRSPGMLRQRRHHGRRPGRMHGERKSAQGVAASRLRAGLAGRQSLLRVPVGQGQAVLRDLQFSAVDLPGDWTKSDLAVTGHLDDPKWGECIGREGPPFVSDAEAEFECRLGFHATHAEPAAARQIERLGEGSGGWSARGRLRRDPSPRPEAQGRETNRFGLVDPAARVPGSCANGPTRGRGRTSGRPRRASGGRGTSSRAAAARLERSGSSADNRSTSPTRLSVSGCQRYAYGYSSASRASSLPNSTARYQFFQAGMTIGFSVNRNSAVTPEMSLVLMMTSASVKSSALRPALADTGGVQLVAQLDESGRRRPVTRMGPHQTAERPRSSERRQRLEECRADDGHGAGELCLRRAAFPGGGVQDRSGVRRMLLVPGVLDQAVHDRRPDRACALGDPAPDRSRVPLHDPVPGHEGTRSRRATPSGRRW